MAKRKKRSPNRKRKSRQIVNATKCTYDNIEFKSKLEMYCYKALVREGIPASYEKRSIELLPSFKDSAPFYKTWGKSELLERTANVPSITYTPDFEDNLENPYYGFFIEVKGRANDRYPLTVKLFRKWRNKTECNKDFFELKNEAEVETAIQIIKANL